MLDYTKPIRVLVADDDPAVHETLQEVFSAENLFMISAYDGKQAADMIETEKPDIIVTDIMMPQMDGLEFLRQIRANSDIPVIILSARREEFDRLLGLQLGADDFITKPFSAGEVAARIRIIVHRLTPRRTDDDKKPVATVRNPEVNISAYTVKINGEKIQCTRKEVLILWTLITHPGIVFTREHLIQVVWEDFYSGDARAVDSQIKRLRAKLHGKEDGWNIRIVWGVGYRFGIE